MSKPFTSHILPGEEGVLSLVYKIFFAEIVTSTMIQWLDPMENLKKHFVAPRASTQEKMNLSFRGTDIFLAERYTVRIFDGGSSYSFFPDHPFVKHMLNTPILL